jgi:hypothetical protein
MGSISATPRSSESFRTSGFSLLAGICNVNDDSILRSEIMRARAYVGLGIVAVVLWSGAGCPGPTDPTVDPQNQDPIRTTTLTITLINDSCGTYISPKFAVCPNGMALQPHHFVDPPAVVAPGASVTYTTDQIAGADGDCVASSSNFMVGLPGWGYGPTSNPDAMTYVDTRYVGMLGVQFHCGDTVKLHWSNCATGSGPGTWTSEVIPGPGNSEPTAPFAAP